MSQEQPQAPGTSWRQLWLALAAVLFSVVIIDILFGVCMDQVHARSSNNPVAQIMRSGAQTLIAGSSTSKYSIAPTVFSGRTYNAGENGQSGYYVAALLSALPAGNAVRRVIYALDPADITDGLDGANIPNLRAFAPWSGRDMKLRAWIAYGNPFARWALFSNLYRYRALAPGIVARWLWPNRSPDGFMPLHGSLEGLPARSTAQEPSRQPSSSGLAMLEAIAAEVSRQDLELIVLITPTLGRDRRTETGNRVVLEAMRRIFAHVKFCDLTSMQDARIDRFTQTPAYFHDGPHLMVMAPGSLQRSQCRKSGATAPSNSVVKADAHIGQKELKSSGQSVPELFRAV